MTQTFRKIGFALLFAALTAFSANAQTPKKTKPGKHHCTASCVNGGHVYKHGEKGHVCDVACKSTGTAAGLQDHVCTTACKNGSHHYTHGEKGHTCDTVCKKTGNKR